MIMSLLWATRPRSCRDRWTLHGARLRDVLPEEQESHLPFNELQGLRAHPLEQLVISPLHLLVQAKQGSEHSGICRGEDIKRDVRRGGGEEESRAEGQC